MINLFDRFIAIIQSTKVHFFVHQKFHFENEPKQKALMQSLEDSNLSLLNEVGELLTIKLLVTEIKVSILKSLVFTKTQNLKTLFK